MKDILSLFALSFFPLLEYIKEFPTAGNFLVIYIIYNIQGVTLKSFL